MQNQQNLNSMIQQYQQQRAACESEMNKLQTELAIGENTLNSLLTKCQETFGTTDLNMLNTMLLNLTTEVETLTVELNNLNNQMVQS